MIGKGFISILCFGLMVSCNMNKENQIKPDAAAVGISDEAILDTVQKQTTKYFWDFDQDKPGVTVVQPVNSEYADTHLEEV